MKAYCAKIDDVPWVELPEPFVGNRVKSFGEQEDGPHVYLVEQAAGYTEKRHWHESDTIYIVTRGELHIDSETEGQAVCRPGDIRWVRRGVYYVESAGPEGVEFWLIGSNGSPMMHFDSPESE
ncbi:MAG: cupin domain-containing protein [Rhodobacteraceae bacterium]|nr:cupin domain-containing protein [Paracoccaceae bacterium]